MKLMTLAALSLLVAHQQPSSMKERELVYSVTNYLNQELFLQCNVLSPTGEKEESKVEEKVPSGHSERFASQSLKENCKTSAIVMCKIKKDKEEDPIANLRLSIPCDAIREECALELSIFKDSLKGFYTCKPDSAERLPTQKSIISSKNSHYQNLWSRIIQKL